jgi:hypothetical protein
MNGWSVSGGWVRKSGKEWNVSRGSVRREGGNVLGDYLSCSSPVPQNGGAAIQNRGSTFPRAISKGNFEDMLKYIITYHGD